MSLDGAGLGLAIFAEIRTIVRSLQEHMACYKEAPALFEKVEETLVRLTTYVDDITNTVGASPDAVPKVLRQGFIETLSSVKKTLLDAETSMKEYCDNAFFGGESHFCLTIPNKCRRFFKSKSLKASMTSLQCEIRDATSNLQHLAGQLCTALKMDDLRGVIEEQVLPGEKFRPAFNVPLLSRKVYLDFKSKDTKGSFAAPEGSLKSLVLTSTSAEPVTAARGADFAEGPQSFVHGVSGMAGVGKTVALIAMGHESDVEKHFIDGVLYMSIGANATVGHLTSELWRIMSITGATARAAAARSSKSISDAVAIANVWFQGRKILFLVDDIWPSPARPEGYLPDLKVLLQGSPESRMAISTRSVNIAASGGSYVDFGAHDPCGPTSLAIFLTHAPPSLTGHEHILESAKPILQLCAGLPISLAVAGAAVSRRIIMGSRFESACKAYLKRVSEQTTLYPGAKFLQNAIRLSLQTLDEEYQFHGNTKPAFSVSELYSSLCVLDNQQLAPVSVLARMWDTSEEIAEDVCVMFNSMSLAKMSTKIVDDCEQSELSIHDLHLDFCREIASRNSQVQLWHRRLLNGHINRDSFLDESIKLETGNDLRGFALLEHKPRQWWKEDVPNREYIRKNLCRHMRGARLELELGATVLDLRWIASQGANGGIFQVKNDFNVLQAALLDNEVLVRTDEPVTSVDIISNTVTGVGEALPQGIRVISQALLAYLAGLSKENDWIYRFLERAKKVTPKPFLAPTVSLLRRRVEDLKLDIELNLPGQQNFSYFSTDFSKCERYCATGANQDIAVYSLTNHSRLRWLKGHEQNVSVVKFNADASKLISGSFDKRVIVWDWKESESPFIVLSGHDGVVSSLTLSSDELRIVSGSVDGSVREWSMLTGSLIRETSYGAEVKCVSYCPKTNQIAVGTADGYLRCLSSESGELLFESRSIEDTEAVSAVQFGPEGEVLISGTSHGKATRWLTSNWEKASIASVPGSITHISFDQEGTSAILGTSQGEIRHWPLSQQDLSKYNLSVARIVNGLSFFNNGRDIIVSVRNGYARVWSGPESNPDLDFTDFRNNILFDFDLCSDGKRVATSTHDGMIRLWDTDRGSQIAEYAAPVHGSRRLALSAHGRNIASSSTDGTIIVWNPEIQFSEGDISFEVGDESARCLSFSPGGERLLVCLADEIEIWNVQAKAEKLGQIPSLGNPDTSFSANGRFIITGSSNWTTIWDASERQKVFDSSEKTASQAMSLSEARQTIRTCGPSAQRLWPDLFKTTEVDFSERSTSLTVDNIFEFVFDHFRPSNMQFSQDVFVLSYGGLLSIFKLRS